MDVKLNTNIDIVRYGQTNPAKTRPAPLATDTAQFDGSEKLDRALQAAPDVRPEAVERAQRLIGDVEYPPRETIRRIAVLLAMHLDNEPNEPQ
jgi:hypothetical protein